MCILPGLVALNQFVLCTISGWEGLEAGQPVDSAATYSIPHVEVAFLWQPTLHAGPPSPDLMVADVMAPFFGVVGMTAKEESYESDDGAEEKGAAATTGEGLKAERPSIGVGDYVLYADHHGSSSRAAQVTGFTELHDRPGVVVYRIEYSQPDAFDPRKRGPVTVDGVELDEVRRRQ